MGKTLSQLGLLPVVFCSPTSGQPATPVVIYNANGNALSIATTADLTTGLATKADKNLAFSDQTDDYTLVLGDAGKRVTLTNAGGKTIAVPPNASVAFPVGTEIELFAGGAGQVTIAAGVGVTINSKSGNLKLSAQYSAAVLTKTATNTWTLIGDLSA